MNKYIVIKVQVITWNEWMTKFQSKPFKQLKGWVEFVDFLNSRFYGLTLKGHGFYFIPSLKSHKTSLQL